MRAPDLSSRWPLRARWRLRFSAGCLGASGGYEGALVTRHMWGGISLAAALVLCCAIRAWNTKLYGVALFATVCLMAWTSDQGGKLTHGEGFLTEHMPGSLRSLLGVAPVVKKHVAAKLNDSGSRDLRKCVESQCLRFDSGFRCVFRFARGAHL